MPGRSFSQKIFDILLSLHPAQRILFSAFVSGIVFLLTRASQHNPLTRIMLLWDVFALCLTLIEWVVILKRSPSQIRQFATREDQSLIYLFVLIITACFASMFTVLLLILSKDLSRVAEIRYVGVAVAGMILSWVMVHTVFCIHYAHMYYDNDDADKTKDKAGLEFPSETQPDYLDFAYFSFVIGMTFQVSDVQITSRRIRRFALVHGLLSFALNTFVVAMTINLIAGLKK